MTVYAAVSTPGAKRPSARLRIRTGTRPSSASASTAAASPSSASTAGRSHARAREAPRSLRAIPLRLVEASSAFECTGRQLRAREAQRQRESDEPLLRAVVEITLEPLPLGIACLDDARARRAQLFEPSSTSAWSRSFSSASRAAAATSSTSCSSSRRPGACVSTATTRPSWTSLVCSRRSSSSTGRPCASTSRSVVSSG